MRLETVWRLFVLSAATVHSVEYRSGSAFLDSDEHFHILWTFTNTDINFTVTADTTGWLGLGFSTNGGMEGADIVIAWVKDGKAFVQDRFAKHQALPRKDKYQDVQLISGSEMNGQTTVIFTRKLNTCDPHDEDFVITADTVRVIWAMSSDNSDPVGTDPVYHYSMRGTRSLYLLAEDPVYPDIPNDAITFDFSNNNFLIPTDRTTYWCGIHKVPSLTSKHHMIKSEAIIPKENLGLVHHMDLHACYDNIERSHYFENKNAEYNCLDNAMPDDRWLCKTIIAAWAIGGGPMYYPIEAGLPFGEKNSPKYVILQTHYDNPQHVSGRRDNSGIRLTLTPTIRANDAGIFYVEMNHGIAVPPKVSEFPVSGFCTSNCTRAFVPDGGIKIFSSLLHAHLLAKKIVVRHFRKGAELDIFSEDRNYDFNYQQDRPFLQPKTLLKGDDLMITCFYSSMERATVTYYGLPTTSEMCMAFFAYYPRQEFTRCGTFPSWALNATSTQEYVKNALGIILLPGQSANIAVSEADSTAVRLKAHQDTYTHLPLPICYGHEERELVSFEVYQVPSASQTPAPGLDTRLTCSSFMAEENGAGSVLVSQLFPVVLCLLMNILNCF